MSDKTKLWINAAAVRAIRTCAQAAVGAIGTAAAMGDVSWAAVLSTSALAGITSILMALAGLPEVKFSEESSEK